MFQRKCLNVDKFEILDDTFYNNLNLNLLLVQLISCVWSRVFTK